VTLSTDPTAPKVFHGIHTIISHAKTFIDGTNHGRGRARRPWYLDEFTDGFSAPGSRVVCSSPVWRVHRILMARHSVALVTGSYPRVKLLIA
jgi:hypothetical protein